MLNFLRNLRRNNMNSKYLKYAFGEIVLVVIGILIALWINNLNEESKEKAYEKRILSELNVALDNDIANFKLYEGLIDGWNYSLIYLTDALNTPNQSELNKDSIYHHLDEIEGFGVYFAYSTGPYESIRSSGLDKISNDDLRSAIANLYSSELPSSGIWINEILRKNIEKKFDLFSELFDSKVTVNDSKVEDELIMTNLKFINDPLFTEILIESKRAISGSIGPMRINRERMEGLRDLIKGEIE